MGFVYDAMLGFVDYNGTDLNLPAKPDMYDYLQSVLREGTHMYSSIPLTNNVEKKGNYESEVVFDALSLKNIIEKGESLLDLPYPIMLVEDPSFLVILDSDSYSSFRASCFGIAKGMGDAFLNSSSLSLPKKGPNGETHFNMPRPLYYNVWEGGISTVRRYEGVIEVEIQAANQLFNNTLLALDRVNYLTSTKKV